MATYKSLTEADLLAFSTGLIAGVDEVGRGPLVGDVVTAAVILDPSKPISGLNDSKKLTEKRRETLFDEICDKALCYHVGRASPAEIDELNILHATMLAMQRAVAGLNIAPELVLVDGNRSPIFIAHNGVSLTSHSIIKGDGLIASISAASIIAKVTRDREMDVLDAAYPQYGFAQHKGYPTKAHFEAIAEHGVFDQYRKSFKPVKALLGL
ncbi:ribonuclease HII [Shewanella sp. SP2S2-4]|uniref:Ribonuclease HII n=1 Tax=Shewanella scandinavica TaxID=3063538 RepID=A0ABU3FWK4_9GAMM|nr:MULTISPECIES: ribonuclease HII [Shewanella]MCL1133447.1 ribonuclease HII [Shewanella hafniensis]MDT3272401.1 ribonuclease HII [Shewanella sp. SP2S2-4]MDT3279755.1 ribonuclease HII [Shewanella sp. SP2S1-2]GIU21696.1 ribonuclease HII [Shewanella hafniensis]